MRLKKRSKRSSFFFARTIVAFSLAFSLSLFLFLFYLSLST